MRVFLLRWVFLAASVVVASILTGLLGLGFHADVSSLDQVGKLFVGVALLSLANATIGRIAKLLTLPLNCLTLGLFSLVVNAAVLWAVARLNYGFTITDKGVGSEFLAAFVASLLISAVNGILRRALPDKKQDD